MNKHIYTSQLASAALVRVKKGQKKCQNVKKYFQLEVNTEDPRYTEGTHTTPIIRYVDDISFTYIDSAEGCTIEVKVFF